MKHYLDENGHIWGFEEDGSQDHLITEAMRALDDAELAALRAPSPAVVKALRIEQIDAELRQIDLDGARPSRDIALAMIAGDTPPSVAVNKLDTLEARAVTLREERATLSAS